MNLFQSLVKRVTTFLPTVCCLILFYLLLPILLPPLPFSSASPPLYLLCQLLFPSFRHSPSYLFPLSFLFPLLPLRLLSSSSYTLSLCPIRTGSMYNYTTLGWTLLGAVIENVSGKSYLQYMKDHIFDPLGMAATQGEFHGKIIHGRAK